ncbi:MAG: radical SAM protein [Bacteroidales bacterium]|nr:radical SAM protein [Bacteroidales bacterium]
MMIFYLAGWFFQTRFLGKQKPLQTVLFITDQCNLSCQHCSVFNHQNPIIKSYERIREELQYSYNLGSRFVDFEGGEPTLWRDGDRNLNDLIDLAKEIGFFTSTVTTNAQRPFGWLKANSIWVSMDGIHEYHDAVRGQGTFDKLIEHVQDSGHKALSANMVIDSNNYVNVADTLEFVKQTPAFQSIAFNFYTPAFQKEDDPLVLDWDKRREVIDYLIAQKKAGAPIMNSCSGLKKMKDLKFKKVCWMCNYILPDGTRLNECVGKSYNVCDQCGFCMAGEMRSVMNFCPDTLLSGLNLRHQN